MLKSKTASEMWNIIDSSLGIEKLGKFITLVLESDSFIPYRKDFLNAFKYFCFHSLELVFHLSHTGTELEALRAFWAHVLLRSCTLLPLRSISLFF